MDQGVEELMLLFNLYGQLTLASGRTYVCLLHVLIDQLAPFHRHKPGWSCWCSHNTQGTYAWISRSTQCPVSRNDIPKEELSPVTDSGDTASYQMFHGLVLLKTPHTRRSWTNQEISPYTPICRCITLTTNCPYGKSPATGYDISLW